MPASLSIRQASSMWAPILPQQKVAVQKRQLSTGQTGLPTNTRWNVLLYFKMNSNTERPNPRHCRGCRCQCQQVLLHGPLIGANIWSVEERWQFLLLVVPPMTCLVHIHQFGDSLSVHFDMTISPARVDDHPVQYHRQTHHKQQSHLARNRPANATDHHQPTTPAWAIRRRQHRHRNHQN
ncbi:hypothetical protein DM01DRAFT_1375938 [Hesseltinella vesiculosa]|uniref:Uncharacterized protein n=1 Tax=Hesseltinella vesiculosa TaxID=101127 RepID=A0A1X2GDP7_9FUNG|nr:hypothetical protein DM01DRAFT_1375938 [Hesseltinella vesiculosa]